MQQSIKQKFIFTNNCIYGLINIFHQFQWEKNKTSFMIKSINNGNPNKKKHKIQIQRYLLPVIDMSHGRWRRKWWRIQVVATKSAVLDTHRRRSVHRRSKSGKASKTFVTEKSGVWLIGWRTCPSHLIDSVWLKTFSRLRCRGFNFLATIELKQ